MLKRRVLRPHDRGGRLAILASAAVLLGAALTGPSTAAQEEDNPVIIAAHWYDRADLDKDGFVTAQELESGRAKQFRRMDGNGDGQLSLDEFRYGIPSGQQVEMDLMQRQFTLMDSDGNGAVTADEFMGYAQALIAAGDSDGDGRLSLDEFTTAFTGE